MLRPVSFSIPSSTELKITFNDEVSRSLGPENFIVSSVSGNVDDLEVTKVSVEGRSVIVKTKPQVSGNFYVLKMLDSDDTLFSSERGIPLVRDDVSRDLYFVGLKGHNPVRDRMLQNVPKIYNLENSNISSILNSQAEEIYKIQKDIGEVLSDNYISQIVTDERRTRSSGATDRLARENAYLIDRVSSKQTNLGLTFKSIDYSDSVDTPRHNFFPDYPVSLQQITEEEEISLSSEGNSFSGFLLSLRNKNIIRLNSVRLIRESDEEDCDNLLGTEYAIELYKYSLREGRYDPEFCFTNASLESNQILISEFGNLDRPILGDRIVVSYDYKDLGIYVNEDSLDIFNIKEVQLESIPGNSTRFFLENAPIVNSNNDIPERGGVQFFVGENTDEESPVFLRELVFNSSKLPSKLGEYAINYDTGEVIVVGGDKIGAGTGSNAVYCSYLYRNLYTKNLDFYIKNADVIAAKNRNLVGSQVSAEFNYDKVFVEGVDYEAPCHKEVFNEPVENRFVSSFVISPENTPVTNVFRIFNQTTGEVYSPLYHTEDEIYFTGQRSPEFKTKESENAEFKLKEQEEVVPVGEFVCPTFSVKIKSSISNSNISFSPGIPAELIQTNSVDYFIRSTGLSGEDPIEDIQISYFGEPNSDNLITYLGINPSVQAPSINELVTIGPLGLVISLENKGVMSSSLDSIGSHVNSSADFSRKDIFLREKYFAEEGVSPTIELVSENSIRSAIEYDDDVFEGNMSRLRRPGDYSIDYRNGLVYVMISADQDYSLGTVTYRYNSCEAENPNIIAVTDASKRINSSINIDESGIRYFDLDNTPTDIIINDLDTSLEVGDGKSQVVGSDNEFYNTLEVLSDYTVVFPSNIAEVSGLYRKKDVFGFLLNSDDFGRRVQDMDSEELSYPASEGGGNIYDSTFMSISENILDLKKRYKTRVVDNAGIFKISILDEEFGSIYSVIHSSTGREVFDDRLNVIKLSGISAVYAEDLGGSVVVDIASGTDLSGVDASGDYLIDSNGARFVIADVDTLTSKITVLSPADNNSEAGLPELGPVDIIVKANILITDSGVEISVPSDSFLNNNDIIEVSYITKSIPSVGQLLAADVRYGKVFLSYTYSYDNVFISYEYGDNQINWSVGSAIFEGEDYFVSYRYGALRDALRKNFGILTKIPFFQNFSETVDRELYRNALAGTMQAFTSGPTPQSFRNLIKSFTDIDPNIDESAFGSWILGRDYLSPEEVKIDGSIVFKSAKFKEGILVGDDTVISTSALSNINVDEGTISAWIAPEWAGIDNDATITVDIDNIGVKKYRHNFTENVFGSENNFSILKTEDHIGGIDDSLQTITLHNFTSNFSDSGEEEEFIGALALAKEESSVNRATRTELDISLKVVDFSAPDLINPPRRRFSEDIAFSRAGIGRLGLGHSASESTRGIMTAGLEMDLFRFCSPAFLSMGDGNKLFFSLFSMRPLYNPESGRIYTFRAGEENSVKNDFPEYDGGYATRNCTCSIENSVPELSKFRDKGFQTVRIDLDDAVNLSYIRDTDTVFSDTPSVFRILDAKGGTYEVWAFIDESGDIVDSFIPDNVYGFLVNRIPENMQHVTAHGTDSINSSMPTGEITLLYQSVSILTKSNPDSREALGYAGGSYVVDWMSDHLNVYVNRDPRNNVVNIRFGKNYFVDIFYTDLIDTDLEKQLVTLLNLDTWFNLEAGHIVADNVNSLSNKIAVGMVDKTTKSTIDIDKINYSIYNRFDLSDIHIGKSARNPSRMPFNINKYDSPNSSVGMPYNIDSSEGVFIGFDNLCLSPLSEDAGQWVFRTRALNSSVLPVGVIVRGLEDYDLVYEELPLEHNFSGKITTNGEFSSVVRSRRDEDSSGCATGVVCDAEYRYCGNGTLEDIGWRKINEVQSDDINFILGGSENESSLWIKSGEFDSVASDGVYRAGPSSFSKDSLGDDMAASNAVYTRLPCYGGAYRSRVYFRALEVDHSSSEGLQNRFEGIISGTLSGISPIQIYDGEVNVKLSLGVSDFGHPVVIVIDGGNNSILDIAYFEWNNARFNSLVVSKDLDLNGVIIESDSEILSRIPLDEFSESEVGCVILNEPFIATYVFDGFVVDSKDFHSRYSGNILDIGSIEFGSRLEGGTPMLESDDIFISTDSTIRFSFVTPEKEIDGYVDGYIDGYADGYVDSVAFDVDEILFSSDLNRYIFDSGETDSKNRISMFKDGKGFLNFRIYDTPLGPGNDVRMFNIATNIKHFKANDLHHVAASWRLNTDFQQDEMHLFIDGLEVPNIYRFGGVVPVRLNDKFSDVSKEVLQDFIVDSIEYPETMYDGTVLAGTSTFYSDSLSFDETMIGRSIIILGSDIAPTYVGGEYIIGGLSGSGAILVSGADLSPIEFNTSASDVKFTMPPVAGIKAEIAADLRNSLFSVFRQDCNGEELELGGVLYTVSDGSISIVSGEKVDNPQYRANLDTRVIEFIGQNSECNYVSTVDFSDLDIHLETFGLAFQQVNDNIYLSSSSYFVQDKEPSINSGMSVLLTHAVEPVDIRDVKVRRIVKDRFIPEIYDRKYLEEGILSEFALSLDNSAGMHKLSSDGTQVYKENRGRYLTLSVDSDNIIFCKEDSKPIDGYEEESFASVITVHGETLDGTNKEEFFVYGNGTISGKKLFLNVSSISGSLLLADEYYEPCVLSLFESDLITEPNNNGEYAEVFRYSEGRFIISAAGSGGTYPFELNPGTYNVSYPAFLNINIPRIGDRLFIGCDKDGESQFGGVIDEVRIISEMSSDTRPSHRDTSGTRSITEDFMNPNPHCPGDNTLFLAHFDNPIEVQSRRLRQREFLNTDSNFKYKLDLLDREALLKSINDKEGFESKMIRMGFSLEEAERTFIECHHAQGGPIWNEARTSMTNEMIVSSESVNENFGMSGKFFSSSRPLIIENRLSYFRRNEGTIEFWVSPLIDTITDEEDRYYVDISAVEKVRVRSKNPGEIILPRAAKRITGIRLMSNNQEFSQFFDQSEVDRILFDEIYRSEVTGMLTGGTGVERDFSDGCRLKPDGRSVILSNVLPGAEVDVIVSYIPIDSNGDRISVYKNKDSQIVFEIDAGGTINRIARDVDWTKNSWHRVMCVYKANSQNDMMRMFLDGDDIGHIVYGDPGLTYGAGFLYGQALSSDSSTSNVSYKIAIRDDFRLISLGGIATGASPAMARMDNIRFSNKIRGGERDPSGEFVDFNYSKNTNTIFPVIRDGNTTLLIDFNNDEESDRSYATIIDPERGIFNFDIEILDGFGKINTEEVEDLIIDLVNRLKPAHTNALVKFPRESC